MVMLAILPRPAPRRPRSGTTPRDAAGIRQHRPAVTGRRCAPAGIACVSPTTARSGPAPQRRAIRAKSPLTAPHLTARNRPRRSPSAGRDRHAALARSRRLGPTAADTIPIARPPSRGFAQSGFNEVAFAHAQDVVRDLTEASQSDMQWQRIAPLLPGKPGDPGRSAAQTTGCFSKPSSGSPERARPGATCTKRSDAGTRSSGAFADGRRRACLPKVFKQPVG